MNFLLRHPGVFLAAILVSMSGFRAQAQDIPLPVIPVAVFNITNYGATADGKTLNTAALQKTIDACSAAGGGTVRVPAGNFLTMPFRLASGINLHLDKGAVILISDDITNYPVAKNRCVDSITASGAHDIEISGEGTIDGQGDAWWTAFRADSKMTHRPYMIKLSDCTRLLVTGVTLQNSPMFHLVPQNCTDVTVRGIHIHSPTNAPNTDGIDPSGWNFLISDCAIDTGDDNIAIKPTAGRTPGDKNFAVLNCAFLHGHGVSIGGGSFNGVENLTVSNCTFNGTDSGIRIKTPRGNGGLAQNLTYEKLTMANVKNPIYINDYYPESGAPKDPSTEKAEPVTDRTPINKNITIRDLTVTNCSNAGTIRGIPEMPVADMTFSNVTISAMTGMKIYHARGIRFINSKITIESGKALTTYDAEVTGLDSTTVPPQP
jgi:polygalacturonase